MNSTSNQGPVSLITTVLKRGQRFPQYFYYLPAFLILLEVSASFLVSLISANPYFVNQNRSTVNPFVFLLPFLILLFHIPIAAIKIKIAIQSAQGNVESPRETILSGIRKTPELLWKSILFTISVFIPFFIIVALTTAFLTVSFFIASTFIESKLTKVFTGISFTMIYLLLILLILPFISGIPDIFVIRVISGEKKEIKSSLSYTWKYKKILYPLYGLKLIIIFFLVLLSLSPIFHRLFMEGVSFENWIAFTADYQVNFRNPIPILFTSAINFSIYFVSYIVLATAASIYTENPLEEEKIDS